LEWKGGQTSHVGFEKEEEPELFVVFDQVLRELLCANIHVLSLWEKFDLMRAKVSQALLSNTQGNTADRIPV
jgi:hypothetical protein